MPPLEDPIPMATPEQHPRLVLVDGSSYLYRAFFAIQGLRTSRGLPTNAVYGVVRMMMKVMADFAPHHLAVVFDLPSPTFRHTLYPEYKAHRPPTPEPLVQQIPSVKRLVGAFRWPIVELAGFEADDIIATLARRAREEGAEVIVITGDKDLLPLVASGVTVIDTLKDVRYDRDAVIAKMGVPPEQVTDLLALMGDATDNVPGVPGIGPKTALSLIKAYGPLPDIYGRLERVTPPRVRELLRSHKEQALLSLDLVTLRDDLALPIAWRELTVGEQDKEELMGLFKEFEFFTLVRELTPEDQTKSQRGSYRTVDTPEGLAAVAAEAARAPSLSVDTETTAKDPMRAALVGISLSFREGEGVYIPIGHVGDDGARQVPLPEVLRILGPLLADPALPKVGQNLKYDIIVLARHGLPLAGTLFDTMVAAWLLDPGSRTYKLDDLSLKLLGHRMISYQEVAGRGGSFAEVDIPRATEYSGEDADITLRLADRLRPLVAAAGMTPLAESLEMPLVPVLAGMEMVGVRVDSERLAELSREIAVELATREKRIHELAGEEFLIGSTQQLARILFTKLNLPAVKKTKTGFSTGEEVLRGLAPYHPLPGEVLEYRGLAKLKSTYLDPLPTLVLEQTGRIHSSFNQTQTATGRLSSSDPNLQNIPVRTPRGTEIRRAFVAEEGNLLISADYSQIELRILAHLSLDETLVRTFVTGGDVHAATAAEVFGVMPEMVTPQMRREAKVVNFGIIYGMSAFGLAAELGIDQKSAQLYIDRYMDRYPLVRKWMETTVEGATREGFVTTLLGRRRPIPELTSSDHNERQFGRRLAINTPVQGTAADMIKAAMIRIDHRLALEGRKTRMILQIHDELLLEGPAPEVDAVATIVKEEMEHVIALAVPVTTTLGHGRSWADAHG
jgi:DNA polymerase-1